MNLAPCALLVVTMFAVVPVAQADTAPITPTFEMAKGAIDLADTAWTWTGSVLVVFGPVTEEGRAIRIYDPYTGDVRTAPVGIPDDGSHGRGRAVSVHGNAYLLGLATYECVEDACIVVGTDRVYSFDPATDSLESMHVENAGAFMGIQPVEAGADVYGAALSDSDALGVWRLDTASMKVNYIPIPSDARWRTQSAAVWTGQEIVVFGQMESKEGGDGWPNFVAIDPVRRTSRVIGSQDFVTVPVERGAAWNGKGILLVGGRTSATQAPDNQLVWLDPESGDLQLVGATPGGAMPAGVIFDGTRFLALGSDGRCILRDGESLWIDTTGTSVNAVESRQAPVAVIDVTHGTYSEELGQFWVEVDVCSSTDDGVLVRADIKHDSALYWQEPGEFRRGTWLNAGEYRFTGRVWDDEGLEGLAVRMLTLNDAPPEIQVTWETEGLTVHADASASADQSGPIERFSWDWGDGTYDRDRAPNGDPVAPLPAVSHTYAKAGIYQVTLNVMAPDGQRSVHTEKLVVVPISDVPLNQSSPRTDGDPGQEVPALSLWLGLLAFACVALFYRSKT